MALTSLIYSGNKVNDREQWRRDLADVEITLIAGSFEDGATLTNTSQAVWYEAGGQCYTWDGAFNKVIPAGSTPASTGGVGTGAWLSTGSTNVLSKLNELELALKYGAPLIGELVMWSLVQMPQAFWPDMKMEFLPYNGQAFDTVKYPLLLQMHPTGVLPADMRSMFPRGLDGTRGIDTGRVIMSEQGDAIRNITGSAAVSDTLGLTRASVGTVSGAFAKGSAVLSTPLSGGTANNDARALLMNASLAVPTADENRPKNVAWNMIVRAK